MAGTVAHYSPGPNERLRLAREAKLITRPFNEIIAPWEDRIVTLRVKSNRSGGTEEQWIDLGEEAYLFARAIDDQKAAFAEATRLLPPELANNMRIANTRRALHSAAQALDSILNVLAAPQRH